MTVNVFCISLLGASGIFVFTSIFNPFKVIANRGLCFGVGASLLALTLWVKVQVFF